MTLVIDASVVAAFLVDTGPAGRWADELVSAGDLFAPHLLPVEVASVLRRAAAAGKLAAEVTALAHADLLDLPIQLVPYDPVGDRAWQLRQNLTTYDAWYVAVAELLGAPLATLDDRLTRASGPTCSFITLQDG